MTSQDQHNPGKRQRIASRRRRQCVAVRFAFGMSRASTRELAVRRHRVLACDLRRTPRESRDAAPRLRLGSPVRPSHKEWVPIIHFNFARSIARAKNPRLSVPPDQPISFSFVAASLRPEMLRVIAEAYLRTGSWNAAKTDVLASNALQSRSRASAIRMERELRQRLVRLTPDEIDLAANGNAEERTAVAWLAALKCSSYIFAFATDVLRGKISSLDPILRGSDYEAFFENQSAIHPEILDLTPASRTKVRTIVLTMVREAGIGERHGRDLRIQRPLVPPSVRSAISQDSPHWLAGFLVSDTEIPVI